IVTRNVKAYADAQRTEYLGTIPAGTALLVRSYDKYADVYVYGKICYIDSDALLHDDLSYDFIATLTKGTRVYQRADSSAKSCKIKSKTSVKVCMVSGDWALIQTTGSKGLYGYVKLNSLTDIRFK
ncbi:MAG: hypothetical protein IJ124_06745, partial [Clostridia bacterium]|nr:hypothetical protein [Clostridia bacterium]